MLSLAMALPFFKPAIVDLYHLTNEHTYKNIIKTGKILPYSHPFWRMRLDKGGIEKILGGLGVNFGRIWHMMKADKFIVCFEEPFPRGWTNSGLMRYVINHIQNRTALIDKSGGPIYSFHLEVNPRFVFVREHYYTSPKYYERKYGKNYWLQFMRSPRKSIQTREIAEGVANYLKSTIPYIHYRKGKYIAPEFWYAGDYHLKPFDGIKKLSWRGVKALKG
jgi:hypothetical protein